MRKRTCCKPYIEEGKFNYCPDCGMSIKRGDNSTIDPTILTTEFSIRENELIEEHPAYGQLSFSRRGGGCGEGTTLYGSTITHKSTISMQVVRSQKHSSSYDERFFGANVPLIDIEMSQSQFTEAITSMNMGSGVPITLRAVMGKVMPRCKELSLRQKAEKNVRDKFVQLGVKLEKTMIRVEAIASQKGTIKKADKEELLELYKSFITEIKSNLPFLVNCIDEVVDTSIMQGKDEVEAFWMHKINSLGIQKLDELVSKDPSKLLE